MRKVILSLELFEFEGEVPGHGTISRLPERRSIGILQLYFLSASFSFRLWRSSLQFSQVLEVCLYNLWCKGTVFVLFPDMCYLTRKVSSKRVSNAFVTSPFFCFSAGLLLFRSYVLF